MPPFPRTPWALAVAAAFGCAGDAPPEPPPSQAPSQPEAQAEAVSAALPDSADRALRGMMTYMADAPRFTDCATGASLVMAQEADYISAERAYVDALAPGDPLLVTFQGRMVRRPGMEGGDVDAVVVTDFGAVHPGQGCGAEPVAGRLEGTEWRLVSLPGGADVPENALATLLLDPETKSASGSTGCNRFTGPFDLEGGRLTFGLTAVTRMACPDPLGGLEVDFLEALRLTGGYRFVGGFLELLGEVGTVARFAAPS